jgi:glycerate dehydrogenase
MKIVILDAYATNPGDFSWDNLREFGELTIYDRSNSDQLIERIGDAEIVIISKVQLSRAILEACPKLKYIGLLSTGYNVVDITAAKDLGIVVSNIPTYGTDSVAQFTMGLLLELCHQIGYHSETVKQGEWHNCIDWCYWKTPQYELLNKTLGIIGLGRIGQRFAEMASAFGMRLIAHDDFIDPKLHPTIEIVTLEELYQQSDVIALFVPLLPTTQGMINKHSIAKMKDGVLILNSARGPLIVEEDLTQALEKGKIGGAALDVVSTEPIRADNPLLKAPNIILTPHIAWATKEARTSLMNTVYTNLKAFSEGQPVNNVAE